MNFPHYHRGHITIKKCDKMDRIFDYFDGRYRESVLKKPASEDGPVITISRLTGCDARQVASVLVNDINKKYGTDRWKWVDKDIIYKIASELNTGTQRIENFYKGIELSNLSEMIMAFSGGFVSDLRVKKAIREVVLAMCKEGNLIIVGRGGASIAKDITDSLHIRLVAPMKWRVENIMKKREMSYEDAEKYVIETDEKRDNLIRDFLDKKIKNIDFLFDATLNRKTYSIQELSDLILTLYDRKVSKQIAERKKRQPIF